MKRLLLPTAFALVSLFGSAGYAQQLTQAQFDEAVSRGAVDMPPSLEVQRDNCEKNVVFHEARCFELLGRKYAHAQQPKAIEPVVYKLPPEASKVFANIDKAEQELQRQWQTLESQRVMLLIGANVPEDSRACAASADGIVTCSKPKPETAKSPPKQ